MKWSRFRDVLGTVLGALVGLFCMAGTAHSAGFMLMEQSVSALGNAFSGGAAIAEDATTIYYNPAGLTRLKGQQAIAGVHFIRTSFKFDNQGSTHVLTPLTGEGLTGHDGGDAGQWNVVPNAYYAINLDNDWAFGLGVNVPFGLTTDYKAGWVGRYHTLKSSIMTININPSVAYKVNDKLSIGAGVSAMYIDAEFSQAIDFGTILAAAGDVPQRDDGKVTLKADDWGYGFNLGMLYEFTPDTRMGASYRSRVKQSLSGDANFEVPATAQAIITALNSPTVTIPRFMDGSAGADVTLPAMASLSLFHRYSPQLAVMADVSWTDWSTLNELRIQFADPTQPDSVTTLKWKDAWRFGAGAIYSLNDKLDLRSGVMYDRTPIPDAEHRTPRLPDQDRLWVAVGSGYKINDASTFDIAYCHLFMVGDSKINMDPVGENATRGGLKGDYTNSGDIVSAQVSYRW